MALTSFQAGGTSFSVAKRGYDRVEVDAFIEEAVETIRDYEQQLIEERRRIRLLERDPRRPVADATIVRTESERMLREADSRLRAARSAAAEIIANARRRAADLGDVPHDVDDRARVEIAVDEDLSVVVDEAPTLSFYQKRLVGLHERIDNAR